MARAAANGFSSNPFGSAGPNTSTSHYLRTADWTATAAAAAAASMYDAPPSGNYAVAVGDHHRPTRMSPERASTTATTAGAVGLAAHQLGRGKDK